MSHMLTCEQFEDRIQGLMDQRQELTGDPLLDSHKLTCASCQALLDSYQSLDDSFSGKLPVELTMTQVSQPVAISPGGFRYWPIVATLALGILIGVFAAPFMNSNRDESANDDVSAIADSDLIDVDQSVADSGDSISNPLGQDLDMDMQIAKDTPTPVVPREAKPVPKRLHQDQALIRALCILTKAPLLQADRLNMFRREPEPISPILNFKFRQRMRELPQHRLWVCAGPGKANPHVMIARINTAHGELKTPRAALIIL